MITIQTTTIPMDMIIPETRYQVEIFKLLDIVLKVF